jgi:hypothetical protein
MAFWNYAGFFGSTLDCSAEAGVVSATAKFAQAPLDILGDKLRGYVNLVYDLHEQGQGDRGMRGADAPPAPGCDRRFSPDHNVPVTIWMHRGCVPFISPREFGRSTGRRWKPIVERSGQADTRCCSTQRNWDYHLERFGKLAEKASSSMSIGRHLQGQEGACHKFCLSGGIPNDVLSIGAGSSRGLLPEGHRRRGATAAIMDASALIWMMPR